MHRRNLDGVNGIPQRPGSTRQKSQLMHVGHRDSSRLLPVLWPMKNNAKHVSFRHWWKPRKISEKDGRGFCVITRVIQPPWSDGQLPSVWSSDPERVRRPNVYNQFVSIRGSEGQTTTLSIGWSSDPTPLFPFLGFGFKLQTWPPLPDLPVSPTWYL